MSNLDAGCLATIALINRQAHSEVAYASRQGRIPNARHSERSEESLFDVIHEQQSVFSLRKLRSECQACFHIANHQNVNFTEPNNENKVLPP